MPRKRATGRARTGLVVVAAALAVAACQPLPRGWQAVPVLGLTSTDGGRIEVATDGTSSVAVRPSPGGDARVVWADPATLPRVDQQACATWRSLGASTGQPGVALRIRRDGTRTRAVTVTDGVVYGLRWAFNVHVWDTAVPGRDGAKVQPVSSTSLRATFFPGNRLVPLPWRLCARVRGDRLDFKVWPTAGPEPRWGDERYGATVTLPAAFTYAGRPGFFAGHLAAGDQLRQVDQYAGGLIRADDARRPFGAGLLLGTRSRLAPGSHRSPRDGSPRRPDPPNG